MDVFNGNRINESDICLYLKKNKPSLSDSALKWELHHFIKENGLVRVGVKTFVVKGRQYDYEYQSPLTLSINDYISNTFPEVKVVLWESRQLNEWLNFLRNTNVIYVEVEKECIDYVFSSLNDAFGGEHLALLNPDQDSIARYLRDDLIIVKPLYSKSPVNKVDKKIKLEKLIVDILINDIALDTRSVEDIILGIKESYDIDFDKALAYASRRRVKEKLQEMWGNKQ